LRRRPLSRIIFSPDCGKYVWHSIQEGKDNDNNLLNVGILNFLLDATRI